MAQGITQNEAQVLILVAELGSNQKAADRVGIPLQRVKNLLLEARQRTGAKTTLQLYHQLVRGIRFVTETHQRIETEEAP